MVGRHCSPVNRVRSRHESHLDPLASLSHTQTSPSGWQESLDDEDSSFKSEQNPFLAMPGLEDCQLSGLRSALPKPVEEVTTSDRQRALWRQARGGAEIRQVRIFRSEALYSSEGASSPFIPPELPQETPISHHHWQTDAAIKKQQKAMGVIAAALSKGLEMMKAPMMEISAIAEASLIPEHRERLLEAVGVIQSDAMPPVGHALRFLAAGFIDLAIKRRELVANAVKDKLLQSQLRSCPLGFDSFYKEDVSGLLTAAVTRQTQYSLTSAIRDNKRPAPRRQERSRSPLRRSQDESSHHRQREARTYRGGSSYRGRRPFRGSSSFRGGRGRGRASGKKY